MSAIISGLKPFWNKLLPAGLAIKGIAKKNPRLAKFITNATANGYGADRILEFLRSKLDPNQDYLESRVASGEARPDERIALKEANQSGLLRKAAAGAIGLATGSSGLFDLSEEEAQEPGVGQAVKEEAKEAPSPIDILSSHPLSADIDKALKLGEGYASIAEYLKNVHEEDAFALEEALGMPLSEAIREYAKRKKGKKGMRQQLREDFESQDSGLDQALSRLEGLLG